MIKRNYRNLTIVNLKLISLFKVQIIIKSCLIILDKS